MKDSLFWTTLYMVITVTLSVWSLAYLMRTPLDGQYPPKSSANRTIDRDTLLENTKDIDYMRVKVGELQVDIREQQREIRELKLTVESAKNTVVSMVSIVGILLTVLSLVPQFIKKKQTHRQHARRDEGEDEDSEL
jgi:hypothetical protein